jgi:hypothetical protein
MARHKVEICGVNTANIKVLTNEEMVELFKKYQNGDKFAKEDLVNGNLKLVLSILRKYNNRTDNSNKNYKRIEKLKYQTYSSQNNQEYQNIYF